MIVEYDYVASGKDWSGGRAKLDMEPAEIPAKLRELRRSMLSALKRLEKASDALGTVDYANTSMRRRSVMRVNLDLLCQERDNLASMIVALEAVA